MSGAIAAGDDPLIDDPEVTMSDPTNAAPPSDAAGVSGAGEGNGATQAFQAEVSRLLHLMVHAVYTEKDIFLRELISNASDACDKLRYEAIATPALLSDDTALQITLEPDAEARTLTIRDNGIGMSAQELADNLGTIARSGTRAFLEQASGAEAHKALIGQFGVGFYSAFMVADRLEVVSVKAGSDEAQLWSSDGANGFTVTPVEGDARRGVKRGTAVVLHLKDDADAFLEPHTLERIVRTYSDHILFPVLLAASTGDADGDEAAPEARGEANGEARQINTASALWQRAKADITEDEYKEAYRTVGGMFDEPALTIHYKAEGRQEYAVMLFVPKMRPFDLFDAERKGRAKLYVRRVFITDDAQLLPSYLRFVRGVVDSEDVPLNISREMLQNNPLVAQIRRAVTGRVLNELSGLAKRDAEAFEAVWDTFGAVMKEGLYEDFERREDVLKLARFRSTQGEGWRSLAAYVEAMPENQTEIYYLVGETLERVKASPQLEAAKARGVEVLLLTDPVDHFWTTAGLDFEGKPLRSLAQREVDLSGIAAAQGDDKAGSDEPEKDASAKDDAANATLIAGLKNALDTAVSDVVASKRLVDSAACLVAPAGAHDRGLEKLLSRQERGEVSKPVLEVNLGHALLKAAQAKHQAEDAAGLADIAGLLLDQAYVLEGEVPQDPAAFSARINRLVLAGLK
ncbi:MAG: molecular chaperone HtpG [Pseudomonadota bacterium]